jgi:hypothetical protein
MKTKHRELKTGDKVSMITFMEVTGRNFGYVKVRDEDGNELSIGEGVFKSNVYSTQFTEEKKISRTAIAEILMSARDAVIQVNFNKQSNADTVHKKLEDADGKKITKKLLTDLLKGEERTMTGYVIGAEPVLGRTVMIDLEKDKVVKPTKEPGVEWDARQRQVDHRTLNWLIYKNVKYTVK